VVQRISAAAFSSTSSRVRWTIEPIEFVCIFGFLDDQLA
jgi:hypothetical protein